MTKFVFSFILLISFSSCTFNKVPTEVLSHPEYKPVLTGDSVVKIVIASTQNFYGKLSSDQVMTPFKEKTLNLSSGGVDYLSSYIKVMRKVHGKSLILLDSGHIFNESFPEKIPQVIQAYQSLGYTGVNLTDRELRILNQVNFESKNVPFISSNILDLKTLKPTAKHSNTPWKLVNIDGVKVGIISVTTFKGVKGKKEDYKRGLYFEDPVLSFLKTRKLLKKKKTNLLVLMVSSNSLDDVHSFIKRLPPNSVDVLVSGNTFSKAKEIEGIPLLQNSGKGKFLSSIELYYDKGDRVIILDKTVNYGPTKICSRFFRSTMDCHFDIESKTSNKRIEMIRESKYETIPAKFLGHEINADTELGHLTNK
ncbi:MAG: hypothetical protein KC493_05645 [Bacteriovoracaceae bacterium]|nr:hypothetical protein [Bacteriovoracaceae bacterium]